MGGQGFPNDLLSLKMGDSRIGPEEDLLTDKGGSFSLDFVVPVQVGGEKEISAKDSGGAEAAKPVPFTVTARFLSIEDLSVTTFGFTPLDVKVGQRIEISGDGLLFNETIQIQLGVSNSLSYASLASGTRSNNDGSFKAVFTVPQMSYGPKTVRLVTSSSQLNTVGVRVVGQISTVSPTTGSDGT